MVIVLAPTGVAQDLAGITAPWCVAAGWALDLFRGTQTREHGDTEIATPAAAFPEIRGRFPGYAFDSVSSGRAAGNYLLEVFREPHDGETWICRRDETIRLPCSEIIH